MKSPEEGSVMPEDNNAKFVNKFSDFGIDDQEMIEKLSGFGKIVQVDVFDDFLEIFYRTGKHKKVVVRKGEVRKIDPKTNNVVSTQKHFVIDLHPDDYTDSHIDNEEFEKFFDNKRDDRKDLVEMTKEIKKGKIVD